MSKFDIKNSDYKQLEDISKKIRKKIIETVSKNGGHLSSNLGSVELIIAMHKVFDPDRDAFIYDVSHQAYTHKLLTDRWDSFDTLRQFNGISGYIKPKESRFDYFGAGHSSTSISLAVGSAKAFKLQHSDRKAIAFIGDGAIGSGIVYEALNELGYIKLPVIIILNDNEMSISKPIGAISRVLSKILLTNSYRHTRGFISKILKFLPDIFTILANKFEKSFKLITPGILFEELGIEYIGPVDGHNIKELVTVLTKAKTLNKPVIIHAQTIKGKGYIHSEKDIDAKWHGVAPFDVETGIALNNNKQKNKSATQTYSEALLKLAKEKENVTGVTAAMAEGTGLKKLIEEFPNRFYDVGIAEAHAVTSMATMAKEGFVPFCTIYSTFLQRGFDHLIHDIGIHNSHVVFAIDRAGIVGEDGETHQGLFDVAYLRMIPNFTIFAPRNNKMLINAVNFAYNNNGATAFRYPRGSLEDDEYPSTPFILGELQMLIIGESNTLFIGYGASVNVALEVAKILNDNISVVDLRFVKPLDEKKLKELSKIYKNWFVFSESIKIGGVGSAIGEMLNDNDIFDIKLHSFEIDDIFVDHGNTELVREKLGLLPKQLANKVKKINEGH